MYNLVPGLFFHQAEEQAKAKGAYTKFSDIYQRLSTEQVLYRNRLGQPDLLSLANSPAKLIFQLYEHDSILEREMGALPSEAWPGICVQWSLSLWAILYKDRTLSDVPENIKVFAATGVCVLFFLSPKTTCRMLPPVLCKLGCLCYPGVPHFK